MTLKQFIDLIYGGQVVVKTQIKRESLYSGSTFDLKCPITMKIMELHDFPVVACFQNNSHLEIIIEEVK